VERLQAAMPEFLESVRRAVDARRRACVAEDHANRSGAFSADLNPGVASSIDHDCSSSALILVIAAVNFINLTTARAARRALEVGIRKPLARVAALDRTFWVVGATSIAAVLAIWGGAAAAAVNSFLANRAIFRLVGEAAQMAWIADGALLLALLAGSYPRIGTVSVRAVNVSSRSVGSRESPN